MTEIRNNLAAEINRFHQLACARADEAVANAKQAGTLLLEAKAALKHGDWLSWLEQHIAISPRQVQRYMQVAQGRSLPIRSMSTIERTAKNDTVSHLEVDAPRNLPGDPGSPLSFIPDSSSVYGTVHPDGTIYLVEPSSRHVGFFFVSRLNSDNETYEYTRRPIGAEWVETNLMYYGLVDPAGADWRSESSPGVVSAGETYNERFK